jgi:glycosyltransferase involved in cell wall biosynthesis
LSRIVRTFNPDVLHSFDASSFYFARIAAWWHNVRLVHTKCGGPNPTGGYFPLPDDLVVFSVENQEFFSTRRRFRHTRVRLIPNRVNEVPQDAARIARLRENIAGAEVVFLRIGRLAPCYEEATLQAARLAQRLRADGVPARFLQIGVVHVVESGERVRAALGEQDRLLTEPEFTLNAGELIDAADFVVGTGRSFMEAASRGRVLLAPLEGSTCPVLVTSDNWRELFRTNFSPRGRIAGFDSEANYQAILRIARSPEACRQYADFSRRLFDEHFSAAAAVPAYLKVYEELPAQPRFHPIDAALHTLKVLRSLRISR